MQKFSDDVLKVLRAFPLGRRRNKLAIAIELAEVTQADIARATGLVQPYISNVARGRFRTITVENASKFSRFFGCEVEDLFPARDDAAVA